MYTKKDKADLKAKIASAFAGATAEERKKTLDDMVAELAGDKQRLLMAVTTSLRQMGVKPEEVMFMALTLSAAEFVVDEKPVANTAKFFLSTPRIITDYMRDMPDKDAKKLRAELERQMGINAKYDNSKN